MFWILLAPGIFSSLDYKNPFDVFIAIHMATLHSVPIISSTINIAITDMILLKKDTKYMFWMGICYIFANAMGTIYYGKPLYPIVDWVNIPQTILIFII